MNCAGPLCISYHAHTTHSHTFRIRSFTMLWTSLLAFTALADAAPSWLSKRQGGTTMLRFGCAQVTIDRLDPLVNPGQIPSTHQHQIVGGNGFNASMTTGDVSKTATCTTCAFTKDLSNYWTANMYFKARNGTFKRLTQLGAAYVHVPAHSRRSILWAPVAHWHSFRYITRCCLLTKS